MIKIDNVALKILPFIMILIVMIGIAFGFITQVAPTQRPIYESIIKVEVDYPSLNNKVVYDMTTHADELNSIVNDINSQRYGTWRQSSGGKEGASVVSLTLYRLNTINNTEEITASFSLYPQSLMERADEYRQLNAQGVIRAIDIRKLPALQAIWCDSRNATDYNTPLKHDYC